MRVCVYVHMRLQVCVFSGYQHVAVVQSVAPRAPLGASAHPPPCSMACVSSACSVCVPIHPGVHDGLHRNPAGCQRQPGVHGSGPRADADGV